MILISFLLWQIPNIMIPCMILVGHHLNSVLKEVFFLVGCLRRVMVETNVYWAWVLYLSHLIQMKILWGHYYRPIIPYPKLWSHDSRKVILCITLHLQRRLGLHPLISHIHMSVAKPMIVTPSGVKWVCFIPMKNIYTLFSELFAFLNCG